MRKLSITITGEQAEKIIYRAGEKIGLTNGWNEVVDLILFKLENERYSGGIPKLIQFVKGLRRPRD